VSDGGTRTPLRELEALVAEQAHDMTHGDRVWSTSVDAFPSGADIVHERQRQTVTDTRHGTLYSYKRLRCKCQKCTRANRDYKRGRRARGVPERLA
jgi:hypothetical protein